MKQILVNARSLNNPLSGVQRYTYEITSRLGNQIACVSPAKAFNGFAGHIWEQTALPLLSKNHLLFSPSNTGPLAVENQIVSIMDATTLDHPEWFSSTFASWYQFLLPILAKRVRKIITISEFSKERIVENCGIDPDKVVVTYLSTDRRFFPKSDDEISKVRTNIGIPSKNYILALGSLEPRKNIERLLKAWTNIQQQLPNDIWLVLAGAKGKETIFRKVSFEGLPPRVHLTGYVDDQYLPSLLAGASLFVYPSLYEGFGLPPLEAMACGTPVLTSNTTSLPEVTGDAALLVNPHDTKAIANGIQLIVEDSTLRKHLISKGLERAKLFSWEKAAEKTWQVLQETAEQI